MPEHLFIRPGEQSDPATIVALNEDGHLQSGPEEMQLATAAGRVEGRQVTVMLPAQEVVSCIAQVPAASPSRLRQMLPYSLEDEFAGDVESLHFVPGERNANDALHVSVIGRDRLDYWLSQLRQAGLEPLRICSEADGVPDTPGAVTLFLDGAEILGRRPDGAAFAFSELSLAEVWRLLAAERQDDPAPDRALLFIGSNGAVDRGREIDELRGLVSELDVRELSEGCLPKLAAGLVFRPGANLLQGEFASRSNVRALLKPWRAAAGFAVAFIGLSVVGTGAELLKLSRDEDRLATEAEAICTQSYGMSQLSRCLAEMSRRLGAAGRSGTAAGGGNSFLGTLTALSESIDDSVVIQSIGYRDEVMTLQLMPDNASYLEALEQKLGAEGSYALDLQNTTRDPEGGLRVQLRIVSAAP